MPRSRIGTAAFQAHSHQAKCTQRAQPKSGAGLSTRPRSQSLRRWGGDFTGWGGRGGGLSQAYATYSLCPHASQYLDVCRSRRGLRASLTERKRDVDTLALTDSQFVHADDQ
jgi:hypothetical protein